MMWAEFYYSFMGNEVLKENKKSYYYFVFIFSSIDYVVMNFDWIMLNITVTLKKNEYIYYLVASPLGVTLGEQIIRVVF